MSELLIILRHWEGHTKIDDFRLSTVALEIRIIFENGVNWLRAESTLQITVLKVSSPNLHSWVTILWYVSRLNLVDLWIVVVLKLRRVCAIREITDNWHLHVNDFLLLVRGTVVAHQAQMIIFAFALNSFQILLFVWALYVRGANNDITKFALGVLVLLLPDGEGTSAD